MRRRVVRRRAGVLLWPGPARPGTAAGRWLPAPCPSSPAGLPCRAPGAITPETCGVTVTLATEVTVPSALMITGMLARRAMATPTVLGGPPRPTGLAPGAPEATVGGRWVRYQASPPSKTRLAIAIRLPSQRRRGGSDATDSLASALRVAGSGWVMMGASVIPAQRASRLMIISAAARRRRRPRPG